MCNISVKIQDAQPLEPVNPEVQVVQDELVASKMREAEANSSFKEMQQKLRHLEKQWQVRKELTLQSGFLQFLIERQTDIVHLSPLLLRFESLRLLQSSVRLDLFVSRISSVMA